MTTQEHALIVHMLAKQSHMLLSVFEALKAKGIMTDTDFQEFQVLLQQRPGHDESVMTQTWMQYAAFARLLGVEIQGIQPETSLTLQ